MEPSNGTYQDGVWGENRQMIRRALERLEEKLSPDWQAGSTRLGPPQEREIASERDT